MGLFSSSKSTFPWVQLTSSEQLDELIRQSHEIPVVLFKHSTRCTISAMALSRFERNWRSNEDKYICVYIDLLAYRPVSNEITEKTGVPHASPQAILLKDGKVVHSSTHSSIDAHEIQSLL